MILHYLETFMLICFGSAWPFAISKTLRNRSGEGKSILFLFINVIGYSTGIYIHILENSYNVMLFYCLNATMVIIDLTLVIFFRINTKKSINTQLTYK